MASKKKQTVSLMIDPVEWSHNPNVVLYGTALRTTGNTFGATITVTSESGASLGTFNVPEKSGFESSYIGKVTVPSVSDFPIHITSKITCTTEFDYSKTPQQALGLKIVKGNDVPVCYQSTLFCNDNLNDPKKDLDYNDFVLTWQLYDTSTD